MTDLSVEGRKRLRGFAAKCSDHDPCCSIWPENRSVKLECDCHFAAIREAVPALLDALAVKEAELENTRKACGNFMVQLDEREMECRKLREVVRQ